MRSLPILAMIVALAGCQSAAKKSPEEPSSLPVYRMTAVLKYDANDDPVLEWVTPQPAKPEGGDPLGVDCRLVLQILENGPAPKKVSVGQSLAPPLRDEAEGARITSIVSVDGNAERHESVIGNVDNVIWSAEHHYEIGDFEMDFDELRASGRFLIELKPGQLGWAVTNTYVSVTLADETELTLSLFK